MFRNKFLLTSGCSFTDNWWTKKRGFPVWPELLAKELDMQCINLGKRGLGNDYILNSIIDKLATEKNKVGLVVVRNNPPGRALSNYFATNMNICCILLKINQYIMNIY